jgi:hypothetical protein
MFEEVGQSQVTSNNNNDGSNSNENTKLSVYKCPAKIFGTLRSTCCSHAAFCAELRRLFIQFFGAYLISILLKKRYSKSVYDYG